MDRDHRPRRVRFDRFMQDALYDPERGYYTRHVRRVGWGGDFSTSATLGHELGRAIARWCLQARRDLGLGHGWHLIELGGGGGELAARILDSLGWWRRRGVTYHVVDVSRSLRARQEERLAGRRIRWHDTVQAALAACGERRAVLIANEFVDAFPCRILRLGPGRTEELWLEKSASGELREAFEDIAGDPAIAGCSALRQTLPEGQRVEVQTSFRDWFTGLTTGVDRAALLLIDYGETIDNLYDRRPLGTIRAYCQQMRLVGDEVYRRQGRQDLTVDVNFTDLQQWATAASWRVAGFETQSAFLDRLLEAPAREGADAFLRDNDGAGQAFKVLDLRLGQVADRR